MNWACKQAKLQEKEGGRDGGREGGVGPEVRETFYYAYFDGRAPSIAPDYETHFGLVSEEGNEPKFALADGFCPEEAREEGEVAQEGGVEDEVEK